MTSTLVFNTNIPPLDDVRVRRAFVLAVDRSRLGEVGGGLPATGGFVPPGIPGHVPNIALPYEPQEARRLLAEAGYPEGKNMPVLNVALMPWVVPYIPKYVLKQWQDLLGVEIIWREHAWADYFEHVKSEQPHIFNLGWEADLPDPDNFLRVGLKILTNWRHDTYEALIVKARGLMDHEHRLELFRKAEEILVQEVPILPLVYLNYHSLVKPWVKNFRLNPMGRPTWHKIIIEPH